MQQSAHALLQHTPCAQENQSAQEPSLPDANPSHPASYPRKFISLSNSCQLFGRQAGKNQFGGSSEFMYFSTKIQSLTLSDQCKSICVEPLTEETVNLQAKIIWNNQTKQQDSAYKCWHKQLNSDVLLTWRRLQSRGKLCVRGTLHCQHHLLQQCPCAAQSCASTSAALILHAGTNAPWSFTSR